MISLTNNHSQWGRSEVVIIYPDWWYMLPYIAAPWIRHGYVFSFWNCIQHIQKKWKTNWSREWNHMDLSKNKVASKNCCCSFVDHLCSPNKTSISSEQFLRINPLLLREAKEGLWNFLQLVEFTFPALELRLFPMWLEKSAIFVLIHLGKSCLNFPGWSQRKVRGKHVSE